MDATPPLGSAMAYDPVRRLDELTLRCRGVVIIGAGKPIVLCAVDWIGIANEGHDLFRERLAQAAGTTPDRVAVHTLHQHDAPGCDLTAERLIRDLGLKDFGRFESGFHRDVMQRAARAVTAALASAQPATHHGWGVAAVKEVASNRRILGPDGKVRAVRYTATRDPALRAEPEGVIDPEVSVLSFWNGDRPVAVLSYYACHPQSYYRTGVPSPDFPGIARFIRGQAVPEALHVHFNGAGGNVGAGKYNDGDKENRMVLAQRLADGMKRALAETKRQPLTEKDVGWETVPVKLPVAPHLKEEELIKDLKAEPARGYVSKADQLAWVVRCKAGHAIDVACLRVGRVPGAAHAGRAVRRVPAGRQEDAAGPAGGDGGLRRLRAGLHRHGRRVRGRGVRNQPPGQQRGAGGRARPDGRHETAPGSQAKTNPPAAAHGASRQPPGSAARSTVEESTR